MLAVVVVVVIIVIVGGKRIFVASLKTKKANF